MAKAKAKEQEPAAKPEDQVYEKPIEETNSIFGTDDDGSADDPAQYENLQEQDTGQEEEEQEQEAEEKEEKDQPDDVLVNMRGALAEERNKRRDLETQIQRMEQRFGVMLETMKPKAKEELAPSKEEDPLGFALWENDQLKKRLGAMEEHVERSQSVSKLAEEDRQNITILSKHVQKYMKKVPDYPDAVNFYRESRLREFEELGMEEDEALRELNSEFKSMSLKALKAEKDPADQMYRLAKARGYVKKAKEQDTEADEKIAQAKRVVKVANKSLGTGSSPTLTELAAMPDDEFEQARKELWGE